MASLAALFMLAVAPAAIAQATSLLEADAIVTDTHDWPRQRLLAFIDPAVQAIRAAGWRCDSVSALRPMMLGEGMVMTCNHFHYRYEFRDRGGVWTVRLI